MTQEVERVLRQVARRQNLRYFGRAAFFWTSVGIGIHAVALLGARVLTLWPDCLAPWTIAIAPALGLLIGWCTHRRADLSGAARATDGHLATDDLFLTALDADHAPGEYQALVHASAHTRTRDVHAGEVAPLPFAGRTVQIASALAILLGAALYLPPMDPFHRDEDKLLLGFQRRQLVAEQKSTESRKKKLEAKALQEPNASEVAQALKEVTKAFREMRRTQRRDNDKRLKQVQQVVGTKWREARAKSQNQGSHAPRLQSLGRIADRKKNDSWRRDIAAGKTDSLRRELSALRDMVEKLAATDDAEERKALRKKMRDRTEDLAEFLKNNASSRQLNETLAKALNQLQAMATPELAKVAQQALEKTLELSALELQNLAQSLRDMKALEQALKALQAARKANAKGGENGRGPGDNAGGETNGEKGEGAGEDEGQGNGRGPNGDADNLGLDGDGTPDLESLREYERYYEKLLAEQGAGDGQQKGGGMGGPGQGEGGVALENPDQKTNFKTEKSRSALIAGKLLMTLKTEEVGDKGEVRKEYAEGIRKVKQGVGEAILQERVPPGYHEAIRKYFDNLGVEDSAATGKVPRAGKAPETPVKKGG